jgi:hypothetical protein
VILPLALALALAGAASAQEEAAGTARPGVIAMGGLLIFGNAKAPLSFVTVPAKPKTAVDTGEVKVEVCQRGLAIPLTASFRPTTISGFAGNGGYEKALATARARKPDVAGLYDVRVDAHLFSLLGVYRKLCLELTARSYRL